MIPANACLVARVFVPDVGPCVARVDGESLVDVTASFPTMRDLCEQENPAVAVRAAKGNTLGKVADILANAAPDTRNKTKPWLLTPIDLQAIKAAGVTFVVSMRLTPPGSDETSTIEPVRKRLEIYPGLRFKLDPTNDWSDELIGQLVETGAVDSLDLKGQYKGTPVDVETDPELYRKLIDAFPDAWLEDPDVSDETKPILDPVADRVTWDAVIHSVDDIKAQPWMPKMVNIKPSRFGPLHELFAGYDFCDENGIGAYGGGQWELGPGRGHIQYLASIFHPDTPNDVAPSGYNTAGTEPGLPSSPLDPMPTETGFRWGE
jgi:hypothetical protein